MSHSLENNDLFKYIDGNLSSLYTEGLGWPTHLSTIMSCQRTIKQYLYL